jgi:hypothetical protein
MFTFLVKPKIIARAVVLLSEEIPNVQARYRNIGFNLPKNYGNFLPIGDYTQQYENIPYYLLCVWRSRHIYILLF